MEVTSSAYQYDQTIGWPDVVQFFLGLVLGFLRLNFWLFFIINIVIVIVSRRGTSLLTHLAQTLSGVLGYTLATNV